MGDGGACAVANGWPADEEPRVEGGLGEGFWRLLGRPLERPVKPYCTCPGFEYQRVALDTWARIKEGDSPKPITLLIMLVTHGKDRTDINTPDNTLGTVESRNPQEPSMADILNYIKGTPTELVTKIDTVAVDVTLLRADLRNVAERVKEAEDSTEVLNREMDTLKDTVSSRQRLTVRLEGVEA
ncbi:hypothetical protein NDU88_001839 [Pleurodeles waltl]|uniref:Uncharacterized protein n=1 Tax=Pleurodeles waltl TaxID=8319 RepID=A0AAV7KQJ5_PLEWA|nr:hypothetical protein NDU88_001839 [Pleurodeles waltl]